MISDHIAKLLLRLTVGCLMLPHGISKLLNGTAGIQKMVASQGLPEVLGYLVLVGEVAAPLLLIMGLLTRPAALVIAINMLVAVLLAHTSHFFSLAKTGGWSLELQAFFFLTAIAVAIMGAGKYALGGRKSWWS